MSASPVKRLKSSLPSSFAWSIIADDPALVQLIARFLPSDSDIQTDDVKQQTVLTTIVSLCRAIPQASRSLDPSNETFWQRLVLAHFDFTLGEPYNIDDRGGMIGQNSRFENWEDEESESGDDDAEVNEEESEAGDDDGKDEEAESEAEDDGAEENESDDDEEQESEDESDWAIFKAELDAWKAEGPCASCDEFFVEDYGQWAALRVYFRPSQLAFLRDIQEDFALLDSKWPASERILSHLVVLQKLARPEKAFQTESDGEQFVTPVLLRRLDADVTEGIDYDTLKHCGFIPPSWHDGRGVSHRWMGFEGPRPSMDFGESVEDEEFYDLNYATSQEHDIFPRSSTACDFVNLRRLVYDNMDDWRRVHVHFGEHAGPVFYVGRSKRSGRWLGLVGQSDHIGWLWSPSDDSA